VTDCADCWRNIYNSRARQPMRRVLALHLSKAVLVFAIALFYTILVLETSRGHIETDGTYPTRWAGHPATRRGCRSQPTGITEYKSWPANFTLDIDR